MFASYAIDVDRDGAPEFEVYEGEEHDVHYVGSPPVTTASGHDKWWARLRGIADGMALLSVNGHDAPVVAAFGHGELPENSSTNLVWGTSAAILYEVEAHYQIPTPTPPLPTTLGGFSGPELRYAAFRIRRGLANYYGWLAFSTATLGRIDLIAFDVALVPEQRLPMGHVQLRFREVPGGLEIRWNPDIREAILQSTTAVGELEWRTIESIQPGRAAIPLSADPAVLFRLQFGSP